MKKVLSLFISVLMTASLMLNISASVIDPGNMVAPCWAYMSNMDVDLNFSGETGIATVTVSRIYGVTTLLECTLTVYEKVGTRWVEVDSISDSSTRTLFLELNFDAESGITYKAEIEVTAYSSNASESDSASKTKTCP